MGLCKCFGEGEAMGRHGNDSWACQGPFSSLVKGGEEKRPVRFAAGVQLGKWFVGIIFGR